MKQNGNTKWNKLSKKTNPTTEEERRQYSFFGLQRLATAIVAEAIREYKTAGFTIKKLDYKVSTGQMSKRSKKYREIKNECERNMGSILNFFRSRRFSNLCTLNKDWLIQTLNTQIDNYNPEEEA